MSVDIKTPTVLTPAETLVDPLSASRSQSPTPTVKSVHAKDISTLRKYTLLCCFCLAQFLDSFNNSSLFAAIPTLVQALNMTEAQSTWLISAYQLTFAAFLLISGRISDVYSPKGAFVTGIAGLAVLSLGAGFTRQAIALLVLRALLGITAALTIPSSLSLLVAFFPKPKEQARAIGVFGGCGAVANVLGLTIGALLVEYASWPWCFWFVAIISAPLAVVCVLLIPSGTSTRSEGDNSVQAKGMDFVGLSTLTASFILFIFAVTSGNTYGWSSAPVLAPLIIAIALIVTFLYWETRLPEEMAVIPPRTWFFPNFAVLFAIALLPYFWWVVGFTFFTSIWQDVWGWSVVSTVVHLIPNGVAALVMSFTGSLSRIIHPKWLILTGLSMLVISTVLLSMADTPDKYWSYIFPGLLIGSGGAMLTYTHTNIAIFRTSPSSMAGTVGAIFNAALNMGSAIGIAAVDSVETSVNNKNPGATGSLAYKGCTDGYYLLLAIVCLEFLSVAIFYRNKREASDIDEDTNVADKKTTNVVMQEKGIEATNYDRKSIQVTQEPVNRVDIEEV